MRMLIDAHPKDNALIIKSENKEEQDIKTIKLLNLSKNVDPDILSFKLIEKFDILYGHKKELKHLLNFLIKRINSPTNSIKLKGEISSTNSNIINTEVIDEHIELLYENKSSQLKCLKFLLQSCSSSSNMCIIVEHETLLKIIIKILNNQNTTDYDVTLYSTSLFVTVAKFLCFTEKLFSLKIIEIFLKIFYSITKSYSHVNQNELLPKILDIKDKEKTILQNCLQLFIYYTDDHNSCKHYIDLLCKLELIPTLNILSTVKDVIENQIGPLLIHLLFNMSIYKEVIIKYGEHDLVKNLGNFLISGHLIHTDESFHNNMLSLMLNMSFDCKLRIAMLKSGYIDKINNIFKNEKLNKIVKILYNFSLEQNCITRFNGSIIINRLINALVNPRKSTTRKHKLAFEKILPALLINVTTNQTNCFDILSPQNKAAVLCLLDYAIQNRNALLIKFFGNLSMHQSLRLNFQDHLKPLIISVVAADVESFNNTYQNEVIALINALLEDLNCFNSLTRAIDKDVSLLNNLVTFIIAILENDRSKNDDFLLLNTVVLLNVLISKDFSFATLFVQQRILNILSDLMKSKQEDDEFVCQLVYAFYRMMHYDYIQKEIINHESVVPIIIDLMNDKNLFIKQICNSTLNIISVLDPENWGRVIKEEFFIRHNAFWLEMVNETPNINGD